MRRRRCRGRCRNKLGHVGAAGTRGETSWCIFNSQVTASRWNSRQACTARAVIPPPRRAAAARPAVPRPRSHPARPIGAVHTILLVTWGSASEQGASDRAVGRSAAADGRAQPPRRLSGRRPSAREEAGALGRARAAAGRTCHRPQQPLRTLLRCRPLWICFAAAQRSGRPPPRHTHPEPGAAATRRQRPQKPAVGLASFPCGHVRACSLSD